MTTNHTPVIPELHLFCLTHEALTSRLALRLSLPHTTPYSGFMIVLGALSVAKRLRIPFLKA